MSLLATLDALEQAGATADVILAVVRAHVIGQEAKAERRRAQDAARQRAKRVTRSHAESRGHVDGHADSSPRARVEDNNPRLVLTGSTAAVVLRERESETDWPDLSGGPLAKHLIEAVGSPWLDLDKSQALNLTLGRLAAWRRTGASWQHDVIPVVTALCAKRRGPISSWKFFDDAVAQSIADNRSALQIPEASVVPFRATGPPRTIDEKSTANWDHVIAKFERDEQSSN